MTTPIIVPMEDELVHTDEHPTCLDPECPCKDDLSGADVPTLPMTDELWAELTRFLE